MIEKQKLHEICKWIFAWHWVFPPKNKSLTASKSETGKTYTKVKPNSLQCEIRFPIKGLAFLQAQQELPINKQFDSWWGKRACRIEPRTVGREIYSDTLRATNHPPPPPPPVTLTASPPPSRRSPVWQIFVHNVLKAFNGLLWQKAKRFDAQIVDNWCSTNQLYAHD